MAAQSPRAHSPGCPGISIVLFTFNRRRVYAAKAATENQNACFFHAIFSQRLVNQLSIESEFPGEV